MKHLLAAFLIPMLLGVAALASAQTRVAPTPPPINAPPPAAPGSSLSPILTNPGLAGSSTPLGNPAAPSASPLSQQENQAYRNELMSNQRSMDVQGVSPGSDAYRTNQQQLNQLNGSSR